MNIDNNQNTDFKKEVWDLIKNNPQDGFNFLNNVVNSVQDIIKTHDTERTKRESINANKEIAIAKIKSTEKIILSYLERSFDERSNIFKKQFEIIDNAIEKNNLEQLALSLQAINSLAASSPFKALTDIRSTREMLLNNHDIEL